MKDFRFQNYQLRVVRDVKPGLLKIRTTETKPNPNPNTNTNPNPNPNPPNSTYPILTVLTLLNPTI